MKIIKQNLKHGEVRLQPQNIDDLWYLSNIIDPGDQIKGKTFRKIKPSKTERTKIIKKPVFISIKAEKIDFSKDILKVLGVITEAPDDVPKGSHHSFNIESNTIITIIKPVWLKFQIEKLKESTKTQIPKIIILVFDREEATFAITKRSGFDILSEIKGQVEKKAEEKKTKSTFYEELMKVLAEYYKRYNPTSIIVASPAFFKEDFVKTITDEDIKKKIVLASCNSTGKPGVNEVLKRPEVKQALRQDRTAKELGLMEELSSEISKDGLAAYGIKEVKSASDAGAIKILLVSDNFIKKTREKNTYNDLEQIMKTADSLKAEIHILSTENEAGKQLDGLGGVAALLRYKLSY